MRIVAIPVGSGSPEGRNTAYLLPDRRLLVDPGPADGDAWAALLEGVERAGLDVEDVDHVFLTHWHADHVGSAVRFAEAAGAACYAHVEDAPLVGDYARERRRRLERDARRLRAWGVPADLVARLREADGPSPLPDASPVTAVADGDAVAGLSVVPTPGHTLGHAALADADGGHLFVGDAVLPTYTPNVGGGDTRQDDPLAAYRGTLDRIERLDWTDVGPAAVTLFPGHGTEAAFPDRLRTIRDHHRDRAERVLRAVGSAGAATPWVVATTLFGDLAGIHAKMGAGEAAAHLTRLREMGRVERVGDEPMRYAVAGG